MRPPKSDLEALTAKAAGRRGALIQVLQEIQDRFHWLPPEALEHVADALGVPLVRVYGVATFYKSFSLSPRGRHTCTVCMGTACHVRGGAAVLEQFERKLGIAAGQTTADGKYTLERVNCLGACALAPLAVVDGRYYSQMNETKAEAVLAEAEKDEGS
ncbi:MAG: NADH-quinone oxidoreductase subunit NuoE, partial [Candidatus Aminicenantes bacterium]